MTSAGQLLPPPRFFFTLFADVMGRVVWPLSPGLDLGEPRFTKLHVKQTRSILLEFVTRES